MKPVLANEIAAGNEIASVSNGWPNPDSILVTLKIPFCSNHEVLPAQVEYRELNDTYSWKAEYATLEPVHLIICRLE